MSIAEIYYDIKSIICMTNNSMFCLRMKHIKIHHYYIQDQITTNLIEIKILNK